MGKIEIRRRIRLWDSEDKIGLIIGSISHKPLYTLQGGHSPERKARDIYQPLFDRFQVDFVLHGHSHNMQRTHPLKYGGLDNDPIIASNGLDFGSDHGQIYIVNGAGGHELGKFDEPNNKWTPFAYDLGYGYNVLKFRGKSVEVLAKSINGDILDSFTVTK
ncbi:MAG: hypothetical protein P0116_16295 [Candidatus Nitrosocosmicus sp.]|nr:hypothetical protein [Candidatus Nitrosocosmicus sp.]